MKAHGLLLLIVAPLSDALRLPAVRLATPTIGLVPGRENYRCVAPRLTTTASAIDVGEQIQVELEDDDGALVWAAARVQRLEEDGFMVLVTEWDSLPTDDPRREEAYEEGPYRMDEEGEEWRREGSADPKIESLRRENEALRAEIASVAPTASSPADPPPSSSGSLVNVGEQIQVELEDDDGALVWAAARVQRLEEDGFMVLVTEWDSLPTNDPRREEAYEEGPYRMDEEGEEWRRVAPTAMPAGEVMFDRARHETYDYEAEAALTAKLVAEIALLKRFGIDKSERGTWPALSAACDALGRALIESPAPQVREDPRLVGDWELVATTSTDIADRGGVTPVRLRPYLTA